MFGNKPVHTIEQGNIKAAIWVNQTPRGVRYNVKIQRSYRSNGRCAFTSSFGESDLLRVSNVADQAFEWIRRQGVGGNGAGP